MRGGICSDFTTLLRSYDDVTDVRPLLRYGYREESRSIDRYYVISEGDWQTLQSVRSLNPEFGQDGALVFDVLPPVLSYLRQKENVKEEPASREVTIGRKASSLGSGLRLTRKPAGEV